MMTVDQFKQENADQTSKTKSTPELDEFLNLSAGEKRILVCTASANPGQVQYSWSIRNSGHQNDTSTSSYHISESPATERFITVTIGSSINNGFIEVDNVGGLNKSILILQDRLDITNNDVVNDNDEYHGRGNDKLNNGASEDVRTYVCTVNNTVGTHQCTINVQGN